MALSIPEFKAAICYRQEKHRFAIIVNFCINTEIDNNRVKNFIKNKNSGYRQVLVSNPRYRGIIRDMVID
jgi:hypothetical protein